MKINIQQIAIVCHQANKAYCERIGDKTQLDWVNAPEWQRESAIKGVLFRLDNSSVPISAQHESWMKEKVDAGWVHGEVKDADAKTHPCIVPYDQLPMEQKIKDHLFASIVDSFVASGVDIERTFNQPVQV